MTMKKLSPKNTISSSSDAKINGYYVTGNNNCQLVRDQLDDLGLKRYDHLPLGGVKFNWITRSNNIDWKTFDSNFQILNHIYDEKQLSNKSLLLTNLKTYENDLQKSNHLNRIDRNRQIKSEDYIPLKSFLPETYLLDNPTDRIQFKKVFLKEDSLWICKPVGLSCGREIFLFRSQQQLEQLLNEYHQKSQTNRYSTIYYNRLVQRYIANPLLIHQHKFDIRTYFLCICISNEILCFAGQTGYLRLSIYQFDLNDTNKFIHLTNQSIQIKNQDFLSCKDNTGMTMEQFNEYFNQFIQPKMSDQIAKDWVLTQLPEKITKILRQVADSVRTKLVIREGCFGFYGVDILIDEKLNCWLLEINSGPTLDMTNNALEKIIPQCLHEALCIVIESLNNYRSTGSVFPLRQSTIFKYLPPSNHSICRPNSLNSIPIYPSFNNHRIDLTPGVLVPLRRSHRSSLSPNTSNRFSKSAPHQVKQIEKKSRSIDRNRPTSIHRTKMNREHLSYHLTELIQTSQNALLSNS